MEDFEVEAKVRFRGKILQINHIILQTDLDEILPSRPFSTDPWIMRGEYIEREERRRRLVDAVSSNFAHALTEALYKALK